MAGGWSHHLGTSCSPSQPDCCLATPGLQVMCNMADKGWASRAGSKGSGTLRSLWKLTSTRADWDVAREGGLDLHRWSSPGESLSAEPSG